MSQRTGRLPSSRRQPSPRLWQYTRQTYASENSFCGRLQVAVVFGRLRIQVHRIAGLLVARAVGLVARGEFEELVERDDFDGLAQAAKNGGDFLNRVGFAH